MNQPVGGGGGGGENFQKPRKENAFQNSTR